MMRKILAAAMVLFLCMTMCPAEAWAKVSTGSKTWSNGCKYVGQLIKGKAEGKGMVTYPNGRKVTGTWKNDKLNGPGILTEPDGTKLSGVWKNNNWIGHLKLIYAPPSKTAEIPVPTQAATKSLSEQQKWALATAAIYRQYNNTPQDILGTGDSSDVKRNKESLQMYWEVNDTKSARESIVWLRDVGHRSEFITLAAITSLLNDQQIGEWIRQNPSEAKKMRFILDNKDKLGNKSLLAWDYCRLVNLVSQCYSAGYISEEEAWQYIMPAAQALQKTFSSWEEMANNFLLGREYWCETRDPGMEAVVKYLLTNPDSPWKKYPWNTPIK